MKRKIVNINSEKCNGCGLCVNACHEGALKLIDGKAVLTSDSYCDGLGNCLPECPTGAIEIIEREADDYNEEAVKARMQGKPAGQPHLGGCPGSRMRTIERQAARPAAAEIPAMQSELRQWPCQIKLVPVNAPYFQGANLVICADCTAYAYPNIHRFMRNKITLIGCPKLDDEDYSEKLAAILSLNDIQSVTVVRMEVPCCGGMVHYVKNALQNSGKIIPWHVVTISTDGQVLDE
ncbi:MAG TPA: 4Fe-4S binding protein [Caproiciproducens sp.]|nr:4Fe-4S binding protein [Caproiciproducens sp.]